MMRNYIALILAIFLLLACEDEPIDQVALRIENTNEFAYDSVLVVSPSDDHQYGPISANSQSAYYEYEEIYRYAYVNVKYLGKEYILQPIDYVGEQTLDPGFYTYLLELDTTAGTYGGLNLTLVKD